MRLNKFIASTGYCSRRKADELIKQGYVQVNDKIVKDLGIKIDPSKDTVKIKGKSIKLNDRFLYYKIYKPTGYLTALGKDKFGKKTLSDLFEELEFDKSVYPVGRLDFNSEGLLILTNDGELAYKLSHPKFNIQKTYIVEVVGRVNANLFNKLEKGVLLEDGFFKPDVIRINKKTQRTTVFEVVIHSGKKRILRRYFKKFRLPVKRLVRTKIGKISIENLKPKQIKQLNSKEINYLENIKGTKK